MYKMKQQTNQLRHNCSIWLATNVLSIFDENYLLPHNSLMVADMSLGQRIKNVANDLFHILGHLNH